MDIELLFVSVSSPATAGLPEFVASRVDACNLGIRKVDARSKWQDC